MAPHSSTLAWKIPWTEEPGRLQSVGSLLVVFHYIPLHTAPAGQKFGRFHGEDRYTTRESERLARLPMYYGLTLDQVDYICGLIKDFFELEEQ